MFRKQWIIAVCFISLIFSNLGLSALKSRENLLYSAWSKCVEIVLNGNSSTVDVVGVRYYMRLYSFIQRIIDKRVVYPIVKLENGYLDNATIRKRSSEDDELCQQRSNSMFELKQRLDAINVPLIFVMAPAKSHYLDKETPRGCIPEYSNDNADIFLKYLEQKSVPYYDSRMILKNKPQEHYSLFFKGDHHWKPEYALLSFKHFIKDCSQDYIALHKMNTDWINMLSVKSGTLDFWEQFQINKTGEYFIPFERTITHYIPNFDTDITIKTPHLNYEKRGNFESVGLSDYYMHNPPLKISINHNIEHGKVVFIKDSFGLPWFDYLCLSFHEVHMLDVRSYSLSPIDYLEKVKPDIVIILYHPGILKKNYPNMFRFMEQKSTDPFFQQLLHK